VPNVTSFLDSNTLTAKKSYIKVCSFWFNKYKIMEAGFASAERKLYETCAVE